MKELNKYDYFLIGGVLLWIIETGMFGWNATAQSGAEHLFDQVSLIMIAYGGIGGIIFAAKPTVMDGSVYTDIEQLISSLLASQERRIKEELRKKVEGKKEGLVVKNWEDGQPKICNLRCHDSGKESALNEVLALLSPDTQ